MTKATLVLLGIYLLIACSYAYISINHENIATSAVLSLEKQKMDSRLVANNIQAKIVNEKMNDCLNDGIKNADVLYDKNNPFKQFRTAGTQKEYETVVNDNEILCTSKMIETVGLGSSKNAQALTYLLLEQKYAVSPDYAKYAKQDDVALADVRF